MFRELMESKRVLPDKRQKRDSSPFGDAIAPLRMTSFFVILRAGFARRISGLGNSGSKSDPSVASLTRDDKQGQTQGRSFAPLRMTSFFVILRAGFARRISGLGNSGSKSDPSVASLTRDDKQGQTQGRSFAPLRMTSFFVILRAGFARRISGLGNSGSKSDPSVASLTRDDKQGQTQGRSFAPLRMTSFFVILRAGFARSDLPRN